jgi:hypothetical protein
MDDEKKPEEVVPVAKKSSRPKFRGNPSETAMLMNPARLRHKAGGESSSSGLLRLLRKHPKDQSK